MNTVPVTPQIVLAFVFSSIIAYLLGSISFAVIFSRLFAKDDVRNHGSGNAGATNVFRSIGVGAGVATFFCDFGKGALAILVSRLLMSWAGVPADVPENMPMIYIAESVAGLFAVLGHLYPVFFGFRGGKGIMTLAGIIFILSPARFLALLIVFIIAFIFTRTVSVGSIMDGVTYPVITFIHCWFFQRAQQPQIYTTSYVLLQVIVAALFGLVVIFKHRSNIRRILDGTEPKLVIKTKDKGADSPAADAAENTDK